MNTIHDFSMTLIELILVSTGLTWLAATIIAARSGQKTLSRTMLDRGTQQNWLPFLWGGLSGHYFLPGMPHAVDKVWILLIVLACLITSDIVFMFSVKYFSIFPKRLRYPAIWFFIGVVGGAFLWTQPI